MQKNQFNYFSNVTAQRFDVQQARHELFISVPFYPTFIVYLRTQNPPLFRLKDGTIAFRR